MADALANNFQKKLNDLNPSTISVQSLSKWMLFNYKAAVPLVKTWTKEFLRTKPERKLVFLYLANDVLQQSRKKGRDYLDEWGKAMPVAYANLYKTSSHLKKPMAEALRLCTIWQERSMYDSVFLEKLKKALAGEHQPASGTHDEGSSSSHQTRRQDQQAAAAIPGAAGKLAEAQVKIEKFKMELGSVGNQISALPVDLLQGASTHATHDLVGNASQLLSLEKNLLEDYKEELKGSMLVIQKLLNEQVNAFKEVDEKIKVAEQRQQAVEGVRVALGPNTSLQFQAQGGAKPPTMLADSDDEDVEPNAKRQKVEDDGEDYVP